MPIHGCDMRIAELLVEAGIISDPSKVRSVTIEIDVAQVVTARIEQFVDLGDLETVVRKLRVAEDGE